MKRETKKSSKAKLKMIPKNQKKMKSISKKSEFDRKNLHMEESEFTRVAGFSKSLGRKKQVERDATH